MSDRSLSRRAIILGACLAAAIGLGATAWGVFHPGVLKHYSDSPDSIGITQWAERADASDMVRWWTGTWIQADSYYYRPLASYLFWLEYRAFGHNFQGHVVISWLVHAAVCVCVYLLALRLYPGPSRIAAASAILAVVLVNVRLGPEGPHWPVAPVAYSVVAWWPAQTDQMSLLLSLLALLTLDRWLEGESRLGPAQAAGLWVAALLFKEMALVLPLIAGLLALYRHGTAALRPLTPAEEERSALRPGAVWLICLPSLAAAAGFLALRSALIPYGWGIESKPLAFYPRKVIFLLASRPYTILVSHEPWLPIAAAFTAAAVYVWVRLRRRPSAVWLVVALIGGNGLIAQLVSGNFALLTIPGQVGALGTMSLLALGIITLAHVRVGWPWALLGMALAAHLPLLYVWGPHYFYWPAGFWALFNAGLWHYVGLRAREGTLIWPQRPESDDLGARLDSPPEQDV